MIKMTKIEYEIECEIEYEMWLKWAKKSRGKGVNPLFSCYSINY